MFKKKTIEDVDCQNKTILVRVDYNVPIKDGKVADDYRIKQSLPTLKYLLEKKARLILISHLGRPEGRPDAKFSLKPVAAVLAGLIDVKVEFAADCVGPLVEEKLNQLKPGQILLCENLRFHPEEEKNDEGFAKNLAIGSELFVQDGFGVVHRAHASTEAITHFLPSVSGFLLKKEVDTITDVMSKPKRPLMAIIGGAKIADKLDLLKKFISLADVVAVGGAMANTFLLAQNVDIGKSLADRNEVPLARDIIEAGEAEATKRRFVFILPHDAVVSSSVDPAAPTRIVDWSSHVVADVENYPKRVPRSASEVAANEMILDIGPFSGSFIAGSIQLCDTVVWNGTMGVTETESLQGPIGPYAHGSELIIESLLGQFGHRPFSLLGGGDTSGYIESRGLIDQFNHVSTGGGASLELMAGRKLPGVEALANKSSKVQ
jgi:phosphoglycerate kinase